MYRCRRGSVFNYDRYHRSRMRRRSVCVWGFADRPRHLSSSLLAGVPVPSHCRRRRRRLRVEREPSSPCSKVSDFVKKMSEIKNRNSRSVVLSPDRSSTADQPPFPLVRDRP